MRSNGKDAITRTARRLTMSLKHFVTLAVTAMIAIPAVAGAQELAEPPKTLPEPAEPEPEQVWRAREQVWAAVAASPTTPQPEPPRVEPIVEQPTSADVQSAPADTPQHVRVPSLQDFPATTELLRRMGRQVRTQTDRIDEALTNLLRPRAEGTLALAPYVPNEAWAQVVANLYDDKCKEARDGMRKLTGKPDAKSDPALRYMWARIQMCAGEATKGRATLESLAQHEGAVGILAARRLGRAVPTVRATDDSDGMVLSARLRRIREMSKKDPAAAMLQLYALRKETTSRMERFRVEQARAELLERSGKLDAAAEAYLQLYRKSRSWSVNGLIEDRIERLERKTKKRILTYGERIDRMRTLIARGRYKDAKQVSIENAKIRGVGGKEIRGWMFYRQALQAEREKDRDKALTLFASADKLVRDDEVRPRLYYGWARALRRMDQDKKAIALYERLCKEYPSNLLCPEATYEAGRLLQYGNDHKGAIAKFETVLKKWPDADEVSDSLWRSAFSHYMVGDYAAMEAPLQQLASQFGHETDESDLSLSLKASYWLAMSAYRQGNRPEASRRFQTTIDRGPLTWYGRLAAQRMTEAGWTPVVSKPSSQITNADLQNFGTLRIRTSPRLEVAAEYVRLGLYREAEAELADQASALPVPDGTHRLLAATFLANGRPDRAHWLMKRHLDPGGPTQSTLRDWGTAFPLNYMEFSHEYAEAAGVSPFLVQAIIRQESGFRPRVISWAGAVGLMQLMPTTAAYTARLFDEKRTKFRKNELKDPELNIRLGSKYIRLHTTHAADNIPLALAGYNAGPAALESWVERYGTRELDAFVESITYREARGYVRKVYTSYVTYAALYGGELPAPALRVPTKLRKWGKPPALSWAIEPVRGQLAVNR